MFPFEAEKALEEWHRVLKPGGELVIECPNVEKSIAYIRKSREFTMSSLLGMGGLYGDVSQKNPYYGHRWGYTPITLSSLLRRQGFDNPKVLKPLTHEPSRDMRVETYKHSDIGHPLWSTKQPAGPRPHLFWFLIGGPEIASSRIHGVNIHRYLKLQDWESTILLEPVGSDWIGDIPLSLAQVLKLNLFRAGDVAIFQKLAGVNTATLIEHLTGLGVITVFIDCDTPIKAAEANVALWTVCLSANMAQRYRHAGFRRVVYLPEPAEIFIDQFATHPISSDRIRCLWFGNWSAERAQDVEAIRSIISETEFRDFELRVVSNSPEADVTWSQDALLREFEIADIVVIPLTNDREQEQAKSSNRALQAMAAGLPVIASSLPAYWEVIENGWNGYLCVDSEDWRAALRLLRDPITRKNVANNAYSYASEVASIEVVGALWASFFENIGADHRNNSCGTAHWLVRFRAHRLRALFFAGLALKVSNHSHRLIYLAHAWAMWPFSLDLWRLTAQFGLRVVHRVRRHSMRWSRPQQ
jgi:hypothetical protein